MAVTNVEEMPDGQRFVMKRSGRKIVRIYERAFKVFTDSALTRQIEVVVASGLPTFDDYYQNDHEYDSGAYVDSIEPEQTNDNPLEWTVKISYSSDVEKELTGDDQGDNTGDSSDGGSLKADPLKRPPILAYSTRARKTVLEEDYNDPAKAFVNSAGEKYDPPYEDDDYNQVITIRRNIQNFDQNLAWDTVGSVNEDVWQGKARRSVKICKWDAQQREENGVVFFEELMELELQFPNWDVWILNAGSYSLDENGNKLDNVSGRGIQINGKILLDDDGVALLRTVRKPGVGNPPVANQLCELTPVSMVGIKVGSLLRIGTGDNEEEVVVTAVTDTTFTAFFLNFNFGILPICGAPTYKIFRPKRLRPFIPLKIPRV